MIEMTPLPFYPLTRSHHIPTIPQCPHHLLNMPKKCLFSGCEGMSRAWQGKKNQGEAE